MRRWAHLPLVPDARSARIQVIEDEVAALEAALRALPVRQSGTLAAGGSAPLRASAATSHQDASVQAALHDLMGRLQKLQVEAVGPGELEPAAAVALPPPRSSQATRPARPASASGTSHRPRSAPYHATVDSPDDASVASWSADAFGRTRNPGWCEAARLPTPEDASGRRRRAHSLARALLPAEAPAASEALAAPPGAQVSPPPQGAVCAARET